MIAWILCAGFGLYDVLLLPLHALPIGFGYLLFDKIRRPAVRRGWLLALGVPLLICDILYFPFGVHEYLLGMIAALFADIFIGFAILNLARHFRVTGQEAN